MRIQRSVEIAAPPEKIWPFLVEPDKIMQWFTLLKKFEYTSEQRTGVGTTFYYEENTGLMLAKLNYKVTEWVENERLAFSMTSGPSKRDDQVWAIEAIPSGSRFTLTEDYEMPWAILGKMIVALVGRMIGRRIQEIIDNLKRLVEKQE
ncbi:MAG: SRPBCC family protein [Dehalococcoidales bacterium]|nr:MAG: SRPBCC family protein [Dehalococcoidales bacterium]